VLSDFADLHYKVSRIYDHADEADFGTIRKELLADRSAGRVTGAEPRMRSRSSAPVYLAE
jgi:hypothetical protein